MRYLALLRDSFRETLDRKSFVFLGVIAALAIAFCAGVSFRPLDEREALAAMTENFNSIARLSGKAWARTYPDVKFEISDFRTEGDAGKPAYRMRLTAAPAARVEDLVRHWQCVRTGKCREESDRPDPAIAVDAELKKRFLAAKFREAFLPDVDVEAAGEAAWDVSVRAEARRALAGAEEMGLLFGAVSWRPRLPGPVPSGRRYLSSAEVVAIAEIFMGEILAGWLGLLLGIIAMSGSVPGMLQKGTLDLLLCRPVERSKLLVAKYLGGCVYVLLVAGMIIGGCWLALSIRTGHWNFYFPITIATLTFFFAVLYSVSVLAGVLTRSATASAAAAVLTWIACFGVGKYREHLSSPEGFGAPPGLVTSVRFAHLLLPKTWDLGMLNGRIIAKGQFGDAVPVPEWIPTLPLGTVLVSSALFALLMISLACLRFGKNDY